MKLTLYRYSKTKTETLGILKCGDMFLCYTLELPWGNNEKNVSCIPTGTYELVIDKDSDMWVEGVPGRTSIKIHIGNTPEDTEGCILVGENPLIWPTADGDWSMHRSSVAFEKLIKFLTLDYLLIKLEIVDL